MAGYILLLQIYSLILAVMGDYITVYMDFLVVYHWIAITLFLFASLVEVGTQTKQGGRKESTKSTVIQTATCILLLHVYSLIIAAMCYQMRGYIAVYLDYLVEYHWIASTLYAIVVLVAVAKGIRKQRGGNGSTKTTVVQARTQKTRFPLFKNNLLVNTPLINLRGEEGNGLFSWLSRTLRDNNVRVLFLNSRIREQKPDIIFRVDGPKMVVRPSSPRRRRTHGFVAAVRETSRSSRIRIAITHLKLPSEERQALPCALLTSSVTRNSNETFLFDVQLNYKDAASFFRSMARRYNTQKDKSHESRPEGLNSKAQGRLMSNPRRCSQAPGDKHYFRGCKDKVPFQAQGPIHQIASQAQSASYPRGLKPQGFKPLSCNRATGSNDSRGLKSLEDKQAHRSGDNPRGDDSSAVSSSALSSSVVPRNKSTLCPIAFKMAWLRAVTLMVQYLQNVCSTAHVPIGKNEPAVHRAANEAVQTTQVKKTVINKGPINAGDFKSGQSDSSEVNGIQDKDEEDYENEPIIDQLEIEDEDQLDIVLQEAQDALQNGNNGIEGNGVPVVPLLPGNLHGYQAHPPPLDEAPGGPGAPHAPHVQILPAWLLEHQANLANLHAQAQQGPQEDLGPDEEAPLGQGAAQANQANLPLNPLGNQDNVGLQDEANEDQGAPDNPIAHAQHDQPVGPNVNENGEQVLGADAPANAPGHAPVHANGLPPVPQAGQQHPQHAHASGPRNRLLAAARYLKRKLMRRHHGISAMYTPGAPREERSPLGLEEAPAFQGGFIVQHDDEDGMEEERSARCFSGCFGFLLRRLSGAAVPQEYPLQNEQAQEFEEAVANEEDVQVENDVVEELMEANEPHMEEINMIQVQ